MAASLGRVLLNRPLFYGGHPTDKGRTEVVVFFKRSLVKKPKSVMGSDIKSSMGINSLKVSQLFNIFCTYYLLKTSFVKFKFTCMCKPQVKLKTGDFNLFHLQTPSISGWSRHKEQLKGPMPRFLQMLIHQPSSHFIPCKLTFLHFCDSWVKTSSKIGLVAVAFDLILVRIVVDQWQRLKCT